MHGNECIPMPNYTRRLEEHRETLLFAYWAGVPCVVSPHACSELCSKLRSKSITKPLSIWTWVPFPLQFLLRLYERTIALGNNEIRLSTWSRHQTEGTNALDGVRIWFSSRSRHGNDCFQWFHIHVGFDISHASVGFLLGFCQRTNGSMIKERMGTRQSFSLDLGSLRTESLK